MNDANRRLFLVPTAHVIKLHTANGKVHTIEVDVNGKRKFLPLSPSCAVILAASGIESTRLALHSFPTFLMGRNLMAHVRSDFTCRVKRSALPPVPAHVQTAAFLVCGPDGHRPLSSSGHRVDSCTRLGRVAVPHGPRHRDPNAQLANQDPNWITITLRGIGEMRGNTATAVPNETTSWIDLSPFEADEGPACRARTFS